MLTWMAFGAIVVGLMARQLSFGAVLYAVLSLTVVRMLPVFLSLTGTGMSVAEKLFMGWFGPRGLASIVFGVIVFNEKLTGDNTLEVVVACTVVLSVIAHGMTANPLLSALRARSAAFPGQDQRDTSPS
jgi:NhaP-type Na+/H+ or K+/H+ antiporter